MSRTLGLMTGTCLLLVAQCLVIADDGVAPNRLTNAEKAAENKLAFRDDGQGNFVFDTGVVKGSMRKEGTSDTLRNVSYIDPDITINNEHHGLLVPYRFLTPQRRYGVGSWEWHHTGRLLNDGGIQLNWERAADRPFTFSTEYRWKAADTVDMTLVFTPDTDLRNFELFVGSYFNNFSKGAVYTQDFGRGKPGFTETPTDKGVMQLFPRNETVLGVVRDGRWTFPPYPNQWAIRTAFEAPLALAKDNKSGVTVVLMSPPENCFAVSTASPDQGLMALYLSLFGKDVKKNESLTGRARLVFGKNISDGKAVEAYRKYVSELREVQVKDSPKKPNGDQRAAKKAPLDLPSSAKKGPPRKPPAGAKAHGYTKCVIDEKPIAEDVSTGRTGDHKWFSGAWSTPDSLSIDHYKNINGKLAVRLNGNLVSAPPDFSTGKLPYLPGADGFYVEFDVKLSDEDPDHFPALFLMPKEHCHAKLDHYDGDPPEFERWMELDVDEGGFGPGMMGTVHSSTGIFPDYKHEGNPNRSSNKPLRRNQMHTFGAAYDPKRQVVAWWLDGKFMMEAGKPFVPDVAAKQNFYLIITANTRGKHVPYTMMIGGVRAFVPPTSQLPEVDVAVVKSRKNGGTLVLTVSEPDADVQILAEEGQVEDTRLVEKKSESIVVDPGKHRLKVWKDGFELFTENFRIDAGGKETIKAKLTPVPKKVPGPAASQENRDSPAFRKWLEDASRLPGEKQLEVVSTKLMELNPGFYGKLTGLDGRSVPKLNEQGYVNEVKIVTDYVSDISSVRAFHQLWRLDCSGSSAGKGYLSDLSPLKGMILTELNFSSTQVKDLSPLEGMPLEVVHCGYTPVSDLSRLKLSPLNRWGSEPPKLSLFCDHTPISDLSPLRELQLRSIVFSAKNITAGIDVIRQMKSIESIGADAAGLMKPDEFWKKYDAGEFSKSK